MKIQGTNNWIVITHLDGSKSAPVFVDDKSEIETNAESYEVITEVEAQQILGEQE